MVIPAKDQSMGEKIPILKNNGCDSLFGYFIKEHYNNKSMFRIINPDIKHVQLILQKNISIEIIPMHGRHQFLSKFINLGESLLA